MLLLRHDGLPPNAVPMSGGNHAVCDFRPLDRRVLAGFVEQRRSWRLRRNDPVVEVRQDVLIQPIYVDVALRDVLSNIQIDPMVSVD